MSKVVTFGEIMVRLAAPGYQRIAQAMPGRMEVSFAGAEANVAAAVSLLGGSARFVTAVPDNSVGKACISMLQSIGIDTSGIVTCEESRLGVYYIEHGANQRPSSVVYDRSGSAVNQLGPEGYDWPRCLQGADWFHVTGVTPALSEACTRATIEAVRYAKELGLTVSCDLNFRGKLWRWSPHHSSRELARETMAQILPYVDIVVGNEADADDVLGIRAGESNIEQGALEIDRYPEVAQQIAKEFPNVTTVAITLRESMSASFNRWGGMLYDARTDQSYFGPLDDSGAYSPYEIRNIVDRVGAGDAFCGALIFALRDAELRDSFSEAVEFAAAGGALCHTIPGDFNLVSREEVLSVAQGARSGRVRR